MKDFVELINKVADKIKNSDSLIQVVSHYDADGISSAAILSSILIQLNKPFQLTIVKRIKDDVIELVKDRKPKLAIFCDIGSSYLDSLKNIDCEIIICDHHEINGEGNERMIHVNPQKFDLNLSAAGIVYFLAREILHNNSLAPLAVVGMVGDMENINPKMFGSPLIEVGRGLNLYGRFSRPLYRALELSDIPGMSDAAKAIQFLAEIGINSQTNGEWRTLEDLDEDEKRKLNDAIVKELIKHSFSLEEVFSDTLTLKGFPNELRDVKEFATLLNACGRMGEPAIGVAICLGSKKALETAKGLMRGYKRLIANYLRWVEENPSVIKQTDYATYILAKDNIHENLIGTIVSMLYQDKPLIGLAYAEDGIKVSARNKDIDLSEVLMIAAKECGGSGGGHRQAAGCTIPREAENKFIEFLDQLIKEKLIKV
jgi:RecJ-like exonuclease